jgi:hypothetical protein
MSLDTNIKYCQSCIERGLTPTPATREWQVGIYYCDECFNAIIQNMTSLPTGTAAIPLVTEKPKDFKQGPILDFIYEYFQVPKELQFDSVDTVCRNYDKIFNFHAPAVINRDLESLALEIEQLEMSIFYIKYRIEPLSMKIAKLKEERRKEKGLTSYNDNKETYSTKGKPKVKDTQEEKMAKTLGMTVEAYKEMVKKAREREFNKMAGNCPECGGSLPCAEHSGMK